MQRSAISLQLEAVKGALDDAGLPPTAVDGLIPLGPAPNGRGTQAHMFWAEQLGERPVTFMDIGLASGGAAKAALAVSAGLCNVAVLFWGKAGWQQTHRYHATLNPASVMGGR